MPKLRHLTAIPQPIDTLPSLHATALATKELVEVLAGQRGAREDWAVTHGEMPVSNVGDGRWNPVPFVNGWANYPAPFGPAGFRKLSSGLVLMRGLTNAGGAAHICTLPPGYRPGIRMLYIAVTSPQNLCRLDLGTDGALTHTGADPGWLSLNNICFLAEN